MNEATSVGLILPRAAGEGDHAKRGGGGCRRVDFEAFPAVGRQQTTEVGVATAPSTVFGGPPPPLRGGGYETPQGRLARDLILYGLCSVAALAVDWGTLTLLVMRGVPALQAAAIGFMLGMAVTYVASITIVYADRRHGSKLHEAAVFMAIGLAGLGLNEVLLYAFAAGLGLAAPLAKAPTAVMVFLFNFAVRRAMLFAAPEA